MIDKRFILRAGEIVHCGFPSSGSGQAAQCDKVSGFWFLVSDSMYAPISQILDTQYFN
jgi:hypothetical protein